VALRLGAGKVEPFGEPAGVAEGEAGRFERGVERIEAGRDAEVVEDRVVAAQERLSGPDGVRVHRGVVVRVGDDDLGAVVGRRIVAPAAVERCLGVVEAR
jgi:hypothetical protein